MSFPVALRRRGQAFLQGLKIHSYIHKNGLSHTVLGRGPFQTLMKGDSVSIPIECVPAGESEFPSTPREHASTRTGPKGKN